MEITEEGKIANKAQIGALLARNLIFTACFA
jgi:hypothetical protein